MIEPKKGEDLVSDSNLCAINLNGSQKAGCIPFAGTPLVCEGVLAGVASWGALNCGEDHDRSPVVFARVSKGLDWISDVLNQNLE